MTVKISPKSPKFSSGICDLAGSFPQCVLVHCAALATCGALAASLGGRFVLKESSAQCDGQLAYSAKFSKGNSSELKKLLSYILAV